MAARNLQTREIATGITELMAALNVSPGVSEKEARDQGYFSTREAARAMGVNVCTAQRRLKSAHVAGVVERIKVLLDVGGAGYYYRPLKQGGKTKTNSKGRK